MYILTFDTTGILGSVAITDEKGKTFQKVSSEKMSHLKKIIAMVEELLKEANIDKSQISAVAVTVGPGSFTGIRIGVTTARTVAQFLGVKCISVSSLEVFKIFATHDEKVAVIFNARRGQVYGAVYGNNGEEILKPGPYMLTDVFEIVKDFDDVVFYGDGVDAYGDSLEGYRTASEEKRYQTAELAAKVALEKYGKGQLLDYEELLPDYMRMAEAEQKLKDGTLAELRRKKLERFKNA